MLGDLATERDRAHHADAGVATDLGPSRLVHLHTEPARPPRHAELTRPLPDAIAERLPGPLWTHQVEAIELARAGHSVVVASGTSSGKSLCYQVPIAEAASHPIRPGTALALFPTKALAHDQLRALTALAAPGCGGGRLRRRRQPRGAHLGAEARVGRAHQPGDAARRAAAAPRALGDVPRAAPLHRRSTSCTPSAASSAATWRSSPAGCDGSPSTTVPTRCSSAPRPRSARRSGSPAPSAAPRCTRCSTTGRRAVRARVALWQPPLLDAHSGARGSAHREAAALIAGLIDSGRTTLGFARSRRGVEIVAADVRRRLAAVARRARAGLPRRLPRRGAAGHRGRAVRRASSPGWSPPPRSSSASTSAVSTRW